MKIGLRGQITIPKAIREQYNLNPNEEVYFEEVRGELALRKKVADVPRIRKWLGAFQGKPDSIDEFIDDIRGR